MSSVGEGSCRQTLGANVSLVAPPTLLPVDVSSWLKANTVTSFMGSGAVVAEFNQDDTELNQVMSLLR